MSKSIRIPDHLHAEIEELAGREKRSLSNMAAILLEQALGLESAGMSRIMDGDTPVGIVLPDEPDAHFKPDDVKTDFKK